VDTPQPQKTTKNKDKHMTENNETVETPETDDEGTTVAESMDLLAQAQEDLEFAQNQVHEQLRAMVQLHGRQFTTDEGVIHQIRSRNGVPYLTTLKETPKVYLARAARERAEAMLAELQAAGNPLVAQAPVTPVEAEVVETASPTEEGVLTEVLSEDTDSDDEAEIVLQ